MKYIETGSCTPAINLAFEDYFLKGTDLEEDIFMLWRNEPTIVVGRFQNTLEEVNSSFAKAHQIQIVRRISGGGAVYHDLGNLCFSFILHDIKPEVVDKSKYILPLRDALSHLGVEAEVTRRNDLTIEGKKFSGNAMALFRDRLLFHGTLLFDTDLSILDEVLKSSASYITSMGVKSVRSSVTNLKDYLPVKMDILQFKQSMKQFLFNDAPHAVIYAPTQQDLDAINDLVKTKYETWKWNFGRNPNSIIERSYQFPEGILEIHLEVEKGNIKTCQLKCGSDLSLETGQIEKQLENVRYTLENVCNALSDIDLYNNQQTISMCDLAKCIVF